MTVLDEGLGGGYLETRVPETAASCQGYAPNGHHHLAMMINLDGALVAEPKIGSWVSVGSDGTGDLNFAAECQRSTSG